MNILLIPDKFKGSLSSEEVIASLSKGIHTVRPKAKIHAVLASDGGDGFLDAVAIHRDTEQVIMDTLDSLGRSIRARYLWEAKTASAYIELATASGMVLLDETERNPLKTSTYGTGLQIKHAIAKGARKIYLGLGGSATNDGGTGMAKAMGYRFKDHRGRELLPIGGNLEQMDNIEAPQKPEFAGVSFFAINDVNNPLHGIHGAAHVYGRQKGASLTDIESLDHGLMHLDQTVKQHLGSDVAHTPGAGAAGGSAFGLKVFFKAEFISGVEFVLDLAQVDTLVNSIGIDYVITGEGKIDDQTLNGKLIKGVIDMGARFNIPVIGVCGRLDLKQRNLRELGLDHIIESGNPEKSLQYNMDHGAMLLEKATAEFFRDFWG